MKLRLVFNPAQSIQRDLAAWLAASIANPADLETITFSQWDLTQTRLPGASGNSPITVLLDWPSRAELPVGALLLADWDGTTARPIGPATGLAPLLTRSPSTRFAVLLVDSTAAQATPRVLFQATVPTLLGRSRQQRRVVSTSVEALLWWLELCEQRHQLVCIGQKSEARLQPPMQLRLHDRLHALILRLWSVLARILSRQLGKGSNDWQIAIARLDPASGSPVVHHRLPPDRRGWYADPCAVVDRSSTWLFCERWDPGLQRGVIDLFAIEPDRLRPQGTVLEEPFHLSFPRVFQHQGQWFATVESSANRDVRLYEAVDFPFSWQLRRTLLTDEAWVDPILMPFADGWALLVSTPALPSLPRETAPALQLFVASDLLQAPFLPHPCSPLLLDSSSGRNGGLLELQGQRWRVAQSIGYGGAYGRSLTLHRLDRLDGNRYDEVDDDLPWLRSLVRSLHASHLHTLNNCDGWIAVDYRRSYASWGFL